MMRIGRVAREPDYHRRPAFEGDAVSTSVYAFECCACGASGPVDVGGFLIAAWGWREALDAELVALAVEQFRLPIVGKSHDGGMASVRLIACAKCDRPHLLYAGVQEPSHSLYRVTFQGIAEVRGLTTP